MHRFLFFDEKIRSADEARLPAVSGAALYGKGVFTTIAVFDGNPFLWEKHWPRLKSHARKLGVDLQNFPENVVKQALLEVLEANSVRTGRARVTFFDENTEGVWSATTRPVTHLLITTADFRQIKPELALTVSPFRVNSTSPLAGLKSCNYLEPLLALRDARSRGFDEAVRLNERGEVVGACLANIFWVKEKTIFTPALETGCLAGTTRELLLASLAVREVRASPAELAAADEIVLTSAGIGVSAARFENSKVPELSAFNEVKSFLDLAKARA